MVNADSSGRNKVDAHHQSLPAPSSAYFLPYKDEVAPPWMMKEDAMHHAPIRRSKQKEHNPLKLSEIAEALDVPVVILAFQDRDGASRHAMFGIELGTDRDGLAAACFAQCGRGATVVPNMAVHPELSLWTGSLIERGLGFMVGVPLFDDTGARTGSISVVATQKHVAGQGIQVHLLKELGTTFLAQAA